MSELQEQVVQYLRADGFDVALSEDGLIHAMRAQGFTEAETSGDLVIWPVEDQAAANSDNQKRFLETVAHYRAERPATSGVYIANKGTSFFGIENLIRSYGFDQKSVIKRRAPIQYFDTPYTQDHQDGREAKSVIDELLASEAVKNRVAQPFAIRQSTDWGGEPITAGPDLLEHLFQEMRTPVRGAKVRIIDGPAGGGKSNVFDALFTRYYQHFIGSKRSHEVAPRPVIFLPEHLQNRSISDMGALMKSVFESDLAAPVSREQFRWLLINGYAVWMFDGLDEFYAGETDFFDFIERSMLEEGSRAQFLICTRNSLLNTSGRLTSFVERLLQRDKTLVDLYQLMPWGEPQWQQLTSKRAKAFTFMTGGKSEGEAFLAALRENQHLAALAKLPFYCDRLFNYWRENNQRLPDDIFVILERLVEDMLSREEEKLPFDWRIFAHEEVAKTMNGTNGAAPQDGSDAAIKSERDLTQIVEALGKDALLELLGAIAHFQRRYVTEKSGDRFDLQIGDIIDIFLDVHLHSTLSADMVETYRRVLMAIVQFAFFVPGKSMGTVDFDHDQIAEYLAARYTMRCIKRRPESLVEALGTAPLIKGSLYALYLEREIGDDFVLAPQLARQMQTP